MLRKGAAQQFRREVFSLRCTAEGRLDWEWTASASAPSAASASGSASGSVASPVSSQAAERKWWCWEREVTLPGTKGGRLVLRINLPPEAPAAAAAASQQQGAAAAAPPNSNSRRSSAAHLLLPLPDMPISVLKSAVQKNVRLSRGEAAARVALQLLHRAPAELWRRMLIIMFEVRFPEGSVDVTVPCHTLAIAS